MQGLDFKKTKVLLIKEKKERNENFLNSVLQMKCFLCLFC